MDDWRRQIGVAYLVKQRVAQLDVEGLWPFHMPEVGATEREILDAEQRLGETLDPKYREFLSFANGWQGFFQAIDLFGTYDLTGGTRCQRAEELLQTLESLEAACGIAVSECLPIAVSREDIDVCLLASPDAREPGVVYWLAGQLVDRYQDFDAFFLAMVDYNRAEAEALEGNRT
jgi:hypothetical protein